MKITLGRLVWEKRIALLMLFVFVFYLVAINPEIYLWGDNVHYMIVGKSIATGQGLRDIHLPNSPQFTYPIPMFPLMLAPLIYFFDYNLWPLKILVALMGVGTVYLVYRFFKNLLDETHLFLLTLLVAVSPQLVSFSHQVMTEIPYLFLFLLASLYIQKYHCEEQWLTRTGVITAIVFTATILTKSLGIALALATVLYLWWETTRKRLACKKIAFLFAILALVWINLNYSILADLTYKDEFLKASPYAADSAQAGVSDFIARIKGNLWTYYERLPEVVLYRTFLYPSDIFATFTIFALGCGFLYAFLKQRTIMEYYVLIYAAVLILYEPSNLGNYQRYLVPIIPLILYYFIQGLRQITLHISNFVAHRLKYSALNHPQPSIATLSKITHSFSSVVIVILILFNLISTVQASILKTQPEMFDFYIYENNAASLKNLALWTKVHTPPDSLVLVRDKYLFHFWSRRNLLWYPYLPSDAGEEQVLQALDTLNADYIVLDTRADISPSSSDLAIMNTIQQRPDLFQLVYHEGDNKMYRIQAEILLQAK